MPSVRLSTDWLLGFDVMSLDTDKITNPQHVWEAASIFKECHISNVLTKLYHYDNLRPRT